MRSALTQALLVCAAHARFGDRQGLRKHIPGPLCSCGNWGRWHDAGANTPLCCIEQTVNVLQEIAMQLNAHNVTYTLSCGSLLGAVRCGQMIPWDYDGDIEAYGTPKAFSAAINAWRKAHAGPRVTGVFGNIGNVHIGDVHIDIGNSGLPAPATAPCKLGKHNFMCRRDYDRSLTAMYGADWRTPRRWCNWQKLHLCSSVRRSDANMLCA